MLVGEAVAMHSTFRLLLLSVLATPCLAGCVVTVQNRYSLFGLDRLQADSPEQARVWSIMLIGAIVIVSFALSALGMWLFQSLRHRESKTPNEE